MYKKGDLVACLNDSTSGHCKTGQLFIVTKDCANNSTMLFLESLSQNGLRIRYGKSNFVLVRSASNPNVSGSAAIPNTSVAASIAPAPPFKQGNHVRCLKDLPGQFTRGRTYIIKNYYPGISVIHNGIIEVELDDSGNITTGPWKNNFELAFKKGDMVEALADSGMGAFVKGHTYTVSEYPNISGTVGIEKDEHGHPNGWLPEYFKVLVLIAVNTTNAAITATIPAAHPIYFNIGRDPVLDTDEYERKAKVTSDPVCECGKEKHGFASHSDWCDIKD